MAYKAVSQGSGLNDVVNKVRNAAWPIESAERLEIALEAAGFGTWDLDLRNDRSDFRSLRHDQLFGYTKPQAEWSRAIAERHVVDEDKAAFNAAFESALLSGKLQFEVRVLWPDGSTHWIAAHGRTYYDESGRAVHMAGVVRDVTAERSAVRQSAEANALLDAIFEEAPVGLGAWDENLRFLRVNNRLAEINGIPPQDHIGKRPDELLPEITGLEELYERWRDVLRTGVSCLNAEVTGATPAQPGVLRSWNENFFPIRSNGRVIGIGAVVEETTEKKQQDERLRLLLREVNHRAKNLLAVVQVVLRQSAQTPQEHAFLDRFSERLESLAASQDLLVKSSWGGVGLEELVVSQLAHFKDVFGTRLGMHGPNVRLKAAAAQTLGMAIHELGTNASKYGALSVPGGRVDVTWGVNTKEDGVAYLHMRWAESGGPEVTKPARFGFGHKVMTQIVEYALDANARVDFASAGLSWVCEAPADVVLDV